MWGVDAPEAKGMAIFGNVRVGMTGGRHWVLTSIAARPVRRPRLPGLSDPVEMRGR